MPDYFKMLMGVGENASFHASNTLSHIIEKRVILHSPFVVTIKVGELVDRIDIDNAGIVVFSRLRSCLEGELFFILDERNAFKLADLVNLPVKGGKYSDLTEMGMSTIKEVGNMVIGSYLTGLGLVLKKTVPPHLPTLMSGSLHSIFLDILFYPHMALKMAQRVLVETAFQVPDEGIDGYLGLTLKEESIKAVAA